MMTNGSETLKATTFLQNEKLCEGESLKKIKLLNPYNKKTYHMGRLEKYLFIF